MKFTILLLMLLLSARPAVSKMVDCCEAPKKVEPAQCKPQYKPEGWSFDLGGAYTWISLSTPPTYTGSTGEILGKLTYQKPNEFFGQARTFYNIGPLSSESDDATFSEWYSEFVGGYCFSALKNWTITLYAGLGLDFLHCNKLGTASLLPINLRYHLYYAVAGFETHYVWNDWMFGLQADCLPTFDQFLRVVALSQADWCLDNRVGADVRLPIAYRYARNFWLELAPYYRFMPIGAASAILLPERNMNQWGAALTFRFFL